jgi:hypothetical protein
MLISPQSSFPRLFAVAGLVHSAISLAWVAVLVVLVPRRRTLFWSMLAAAMIALLDLRVIAPLIFPEVARLPFWPQFADHLMWGASVGMILQWRWRRREARRTHNVSL